MDEFGDIFQNSLPSVTASEDGENLAEFIPPLNLFRVCVPPNDVERMAIVYGLAAREEYLHSRSDIGLVISQARLAHARDRAIVAAVETDDAEERYLNLAERIRARTERIRRDLNPFREAVDKLLVQSAMGNAIENRGLYAKELAENAARLSDEDISQDIVERFRKQLDHDSELIRGEERIRDESNLYVDPRYFKPFHEYVPGIIEANVASERTAATASDHRVIVELVATVAIDVPQPIQPLGTATWFEPLKTPAVECDSIEYSSLKDRYEVDSDRLRTYLGDPDEYEEYPSEKLYEREGIWIDHALVRTVRELERIVDEQEIDLVDLNSRDLEAVRNELLEAVHGVTRSETNTIQDQPHPLFERPSEAAAGIDVPNLVDVEGGFLARTALESFQQNSGIAALAYPDPEEGKLEYFINPLVDDVPIERVDDPVVPDDVTTFGELWWRTYIQRAVCSLFDRRCEEYRDVIYKSVGSEMERSSGDRREGKTSPQNFVQERDDREILQKAKAIGLPTDPERYIDTAGPKTCPVCRRQSEPIEDCENCRLLSSFQAALSELITTWMEMDHGKRASI